MHLSDLINLRSTFECTLHVLCDLPINLIIFQQLQLDFWYFEVTGIRHKTLKQFQVIQIPHFVSN